MTKLFDPCFCGFHKGSGDGFRLPPKALLRHALALGSSGSGKTVFCKVLVEECVRQGIPAICIDPQGDLCSLAEPATDFDRLAEKGVARELVNEFNERADVVIYTPASDKGVRLAADPISSEIKDLPAGDRLEAITNTAGMITSLLGYDLDSDDGAGLVAVFDRALTSLHERGEFPANLDAFSAYFQSLPESDVEAFGRYLDAKKVTQASRRLARLDVGARKNLFHGGRPIDIEEMLGKRDGSSKVRLSVIYLNTLDNQEDKEFFVGALADRLYQWMLQNPSSDPQALFYIDEVAPFIPPVRKPASKTGLQMIFKQARKYGVACLMATQNPADVDYRAMAQFGTWTLGRLTTRQDLQKVQPSVKSMAPVNVDEIMQQLPAQKPGQFTVISPDHFDAAEGLQTRWLYTRHRTLDEDQIEALCDARGWRKRFPAVTDSHDKAVRRKSSTRKQAEAPSPSRKVVPIVAPEPVEEDPLDVFDRKLAKRAVMTSSEFAEAIDSGIGKARTVLGDLISSNRAAKFREGRRVLYWSKRSNYRPDLGLVEKVEVLLPRIIETRARDIGDSLASNKILGLGNEETVENLEIWYHPCLCVAFQEKVKRGFFKRIFGTNYEQISERIYLHPKSLNLLVYSESNGVQESREPESHASAIRDFDGVGTIKKVRPGELKFEESRWTERESDDLVKRSILERYDLSIRSIVPFFYPVWQITLSSDSRTGMRIVTIDALSGKECLL